MYSSFQTLSNIAYMSVDVDRLILADCILCIVMIVLMTLIVIAMAALPDDVRVCYSLFATTYILFCNRHLSIGIVICRYVFVLHSSAVQSHRQKRLVTGSILTFVFIFPLLMTIASIHYRENAIEFLSKWKLMTSPHHSFQHITCIRMCWKEARILLQPRKFLR